LGRGGRACLACAHAKRKCSGGEPCSGCQRRSIECSYAHTSKAKRIGKGVSDQKGGSIISSQYHSDTVSDDESTQYADQTNTGRGKSARSDSDEATSPTMNQPPERTFSEVQQYTRANRQLGSTNDLESFVPGARYGFEHGQVSTGSQISSIHASHRYSTVRSPTEFMPNAIRGVQNGRTLSSVSSWPTPENGSLNNNALATTLESVSGTDPRVWPQSNLTSINWLPDDWMPDFQIDIEDGAMEAQSHFPASSQANQTPLINMTNAPSQFQSNYNFPPPAFDSPLENPSPESHLSQKTGRFYVDGEGARLPHVGPVSN